MKKRRDSNYTILNQLLLLTATKTFHTIEERKQLLDISCKLLGRHVESHLYRPRAVTTGDSTARTF